MTLRMLQQEYFDPLGFWVIRTVRSDMPNNRYSIIRRGCTVCAHLCKMAFKLKCLFKIMNKTRKSTVLIVVTFKLSLELSLKPQMHELQANGAHG